MNNIYFSKLAYDLYTTNSSKFILAYKITTPLEFDNTFSYTFDASYRLNKSACNTFSVLRFGKRNGNNVCSLHNPEQHSRLYRLAKASLKKPSSRKLSLLSIF